MVLPSDRPWTTDVQYFQSKDVRLLIFPFDSFGTSFADGIYRCGIDVLPTGTHALVSQQVGRTHLVAITQDENRGKIMQVYYVDPELQPEANYEANALFVGHHDAVLYGSARGYLFAWDKTSSRILCGLDHGEGASHFLAKCYDRRSHPEQDVLFKRSG